MERVIRDLNLIESPSLRSGEGKFNAVALDGVRRKNCKSLALLTDI